MLNSSFRKALIALGHDVFMAALSFVLAVYLRLGENFGQAHAFGYLLPGTFLFTLTCALVFVLMRIYRRSWRYTSTQDLLAITQAVTFSVLLFLPVMFLFNRLEHMPRSLMFIDWFVLMALMGGPRFLYRMVLERTMSLGRSSVQESQKIGTLLVGINHYSEPFLRDTVDNPYSNYKILGILDNNPGRQNQTIRNVAVLGAVTQAEAVVAALQAKGQHPQKMLITPDLLTGEEIQQLLQAADKHGLTMSRLPRLTDFSQTQDGGKVEMRPIVLEDLLGRPQKALDREKMRLLVKGKRVLVTGAGGSIGSELVRQIASYAPAHITLLDNSEFNTYSIDNQLQVGFPTISRRAVVGDIRDEKLLDKLFSEEKPTLVFHAAAIKHVPLSETNTCEAVLTNVIGTKQLAEACVKASVETMVMISTDKAVHPTNIMGATKRMAETFIQAFGRSKKGGKTRFVTIRFGNVLGSTGSVIPLFTQQIEKGGPITVTHKDITRYFMTIREAVELILQAASLAASLEESDSRIYVLDMGTPVRINDLAEQLIRLSGFTPHKDIKIEYTGLRPGEKLFEELFYKEENPQPTQAPGVMLASAIESNLADVVWVVKKLESLASARKEKETAELLAQTMPEFRR